MHYDDMEKFREIYKTLRWYRMDAGQEADEDGEPIEWTEIYAFKELLSHQVGHDDMESLIQIWDEELREEMLWEWLSEAGVEESKMNPILFRSLIFCWCC